MSVGPAARARTLARSGDLAGAEAVLARMIAENFDLSVIDVAINLDWTSLNSLNGRVRTSDAAYFFKLHQEEGEEDTIEEYYRGEILQRSGYPVDTPVMVCRKPGRQILLYRFRRDRQLAAACYEMEMGNELSSSAPLAAAQCELDRTIGRIYLGTLHPSTAALSVAEPIHQLFHARLRDHGRAHAVGGRVARFYRDRTVALPGRDLSWDAFARLRWRVNGTAYSDTLEALFARSLAVLEPGQLGACGAVVAHGDAHNANVWIEFGGGAPKLVMFDPAFAGAHVPALLAEVKATFHNIFAHPFWLYHPADAATRIGVDVRHRDGWIEIEHDWRLNPMRAAFLDSKTRFVWRPLLGELKARGLLPEDWPAVLRSALFACPTLTVNLLGDSLRARPPGVVAFAFAMAVIAGSPPAGTGEDVMSEFIAAIAP